MGLAYFRLKTHTTIHTFTWNAWKILEARTEKRWSVPSLAVSNESEILSTLLISYTITSLTLYRWIFRRIGCDKHLIVPFSLSKGAHQRSWSRSRQNTNHGSNKPSLDFPQKRTKEVWLGISNRTDEIVISREEAEEENTSNEFPLRILTRQRKGAWAFVYW